MSEFGLREDLGTAHLTIDGEDWGTWDKLTGGNRTSSVTKYRPGGGEAERNLGGFTSTENITLQRNFDALRDAPNLRRLKNKVNHACSASRQATNGDFNAVGDAEVYIGRVATVTPGDYDSMSNDPRMIQVEIECDDVVP